MNDRIPSRRRFLVQGGTLASAAWFSLNAPALLAAGKAAADRMSADEGWTHITEAEARCLAAVVDQIIPPDDLPGAAEIGVVYFIDRVLGDFAAPMADPLKAGLHDLDQRAAQENGEAREFSALSLDAQARVLTTMEDTPFFDAAIALTHCGMFSMPAWGGNRDMAGWALLGFQSQHGWQPPFGFYDAEAAAGGEGT